MLSHKKKWGGKCVMISGTRRHRREPPHGGVKREGAIRGSESNVELVNSHMLALWGFNGRIQLTGIETRGVKEGKSGDCSTGWL